MSDKEHESDVTNEEAVTSGEENEDQVWQQLTGQEGGETTSEDSSDDNQEADADQADDENADEAISDEDDGGDGPAADEQRPDHDEQREKRLRGIISGKDRALNAKEREIRDLQQKIASFQSAKADDKGKGDGQPDSLEALREEYPDLVGPLMDRLDKLGAAQSGLEEQFGAVSRLHGAQFENHVEEQLSILEEKMPDWQKMVQDNAEDFWNWVDDQPKADRELAEASQDVIQDADATFDLLSRFQTHLSGEEPHQQQSPTSGGKHNRGAKSRRLAGAKSVASRGSQSATGTPQPDETDEVSIWNSIARK